VIAETQVSPMSEFAEPGQPDDKQVILVVRFQSGPDGYIRVPPPIAKVSAARFMMELVRQRQACGEIPPGEVAEITPVR
jgi:hypothetical protein